MRCFASLLVLLAGCGVLRIAREPMPQVAFYSRGPEVARGVIVLLPGLGDRPEAFAERGFVDALAAAAPAYDIVAADAHFGYYRKASLVERLHQDVIAPLRARGYRELWIAGASLGGFGAVAYAERYPEHVRGLFLLAPYLGPSDVVDEVAQVGLCAYRGAEEAKRSPAERDKAAQARANFRFLKRQACEARALRLFYGVGADDRDGRPQAALAGALPRSHVVVLPGGHGWKVWTPLIARLASTAFDSSGGRY